MRVMRSDGCSHSGSYVLSQVHVVVLQVVLLEGGGIDLDDGTLHQSVGTNQLIGGCVVDDRHETGLAGGGLG